MKQVCALLIAITVFTAALAQKNNDKLKVFVDCSNTWCDLTYIKSEINMVDFFLDRLAADVHVLITSTSTNGGTQYQLIFYGQHQFKRITDTLRFSTDPNNTSAETREQLTRNLKIGLVPYIAKTSYASELNIDLKLKTSEEKPAVTKDRWNYWVFNVGGDAYINADKNYHNTTLNGNVTANRITERSKLSLELRTSNNNSTFNYEDASGVVSKYEVKNDNYNLNHVLIMAISQHWSYGYGVSYSTNSFTNIKGRPAFEAALEYNIFKYKDVNNKLLTIQYGLGVMRHNYYDTTVYDKTAENLIGQRISTNLTMNQKWGTIYTGIYFRHYLKNFRLNNLGVNLNANVRVTGGLSFYMYMFGGLIHDQIYLPKGGATEQEVLTRRRQLESSFNFFTGLGINYRFGSKLSNFVNPRLEGGGGSFIY